MTAPDPGRFDPANWRTTPSGLFVPGGAEAASKQEKKGPWARAGGFLTTLLAVITGYLISIPKQALDLEHARSEGRARNTGELNLLVSRVAPDKSDHSQYLVLATLHTKAAGGRAVRVAKIVFKLFLGEQCAGGVEAGDKCSAVSVGVGTSLKPLAEDGRMQACRGRSNTNPAVWLGAPGGQPSDVEWREVSSFETKGMDNGAGPLEPGESGSGSMQWSIELPDRRSGMVGVTAEVQWCEEPAFDGLFGLLPPDCSINGSQLDARDWGAKRFHWRYVSTALLGLASPVQLNGP
jgi:hypothetical protein